MFKSIILSIVILFGILPANAKKKEQTPDPAWAGIAARGRMLAEYDVVAWHASDAVRAMNPTKGSTNSFIARKTEQGWVVVFGRLNAAQDKYLILYQATQGATPQEFNVAENVPYQEDAGYFLFAGRAIEISRKNFHPQNRPYNMAVLPAESNQMYVYIYPAQTRKGIYPLGGDVRFLISPDGTTVLETRPLHKTILEIDSSKIPSGAKQEGGFHIHVLSDVPEDTDVFYVLTRKPSGPEFIGAGKHVYKIEVDGTIGLVK